MNYVDNSPFSSKIIISPQKLELLNRTATVTIETVAVVVRYYVSM